MRIGIGYDVHRLTEGRKLVLLGIEVPYEKGLLGHSDADVAAHALMDAMLGAAGLGDIGLLYPDKDPAYEGISSMLLLRDVTRRVREAGFEPWNLDVTVICEAPKLSPYREAMREILAGTVGIPKERISVKATTEEGLGFTGRGEGIASQAAVLLKEPGDR